MRTRLAFAIGLLLVCVTTAGGARLLWRKYVAPDRTAAPLPAAETTVRQVPRRPLRVAARAPEIETSPPVSTPAPAAGGWRLLLRDATAIGSGRRSIRPRREIAGPASPPADVAPAAPRPTTEATLVAEALFDLRQLHDPRAALSTLDRYARAFPHGVLETEALRTRVEAVIQLHDLKTALALLDGNTAGADRLGDDLLLTRAELRAAAGRFREAVSDFTQVLDSAGRLARDGRRMNGRSTGAPSVWDAWRSPNARALTCSPTSSGFPSGRFAVEVGRLLTAEQPSSRP